MDDSDNPYTVLGVTETASPGEIRRAYRKLALQFHPDKQPDPNERVAATAKFAKIGNAYEILSDPQKRQEYDSLLRQQRQQHTVFMEQQQQQQPPPFPMDSMFHNFFQQAFHDPFQVFNQMFGAEFTQPTGGIMMGGGNFDGRSDPFSNLMPSLFNMGGSSLVMNAAGAGMLTSPFGNNTAAMMNNFMGGNIMGGIPAFGNAGGGLFDAMGTNPAAAGFSNNLLQQQQQWNTTTNQQVMFSSSSSSQAFGGTTAQTVTTQTTTRNINGRVQTVTEQVIQQPDGSVQRFVSDDNNTAPSVHTPQPNAPLLLPGLGNTVLASTNGYAASPLQSQGVTIDELPDDKKDQVDKEKSDKSHQPVKAPAIHSEVELKANWKKDTLQTPGTTSAILATTISSENDEAKDPLQKNTKERKTKRSLPGRDPESKSSLPSAKAEQVPMDKKRRLSSESAAATEDDDDDDNCIKIRKPTVQK